MFCTGFIFRYRVITKKVEMALLNLFSAALMIQFSVADVLLHHHHLVIFIPLLE